MNLFQQLLVLACNFLTYWNVCDSKDKKFKNGKLKKKSIFSVVKSFYAEFIRREKAAKPAMATRDYRVAHASFAPVIDYSEYDTPAFNRFTKASN